MRDKREPTQPNESMAVEGEVLADRLPKVLGSRLRAARTAVGLSQGAAAGAMRDRGFSWRQTTVAKSEAADRPVLFAEVVALSQIYRRPIDYFLYPGTDLDNVLDEAREGVNGTTYALESVGEQIRALQSDYAEYQCTYALASAVVRYRNGSDGGALLDDLQDLLSQWGRSLLEVESVYMALELGERELIAIDRTAMEDVARAELDQYRNMGEHEMPTPELLNGLGDFLDGKEVSASLLSVLREGPHWPSLVAVQLTDLVIDALNRQAR